MLGKGDWKEAEYYISWWWKKQYVWKDKMGYCYVVLPKVFCKESL